MCEQHKDITPVGRVKDHDVAKDVKVYILQVPVKSFISVLQVDSQGSSCLVKHDVLSECCSHFSCLLHHDSFVATNRVRYSLHSWMSADTT